MVLKRLLLMVLIQLFVLVSMQCLMTLPLLLEVLGL
uniref:Uncharacterized protein n=1 Tax=Picea glauca TaxID=3330 RepID=A0A101M0V6_PICGL|nr:hypothetical protein ABT39_MTgene4218 [Picea glauca]QHR87222.1 hypothetical protein Q903MT_gene1231 [Picea sitchensis]